MLIWVALSPGVQIRPGVRPDVLQCREARSPLQMRPSALVEQAAARARVAESKSVVAQHEGEEKPGEEHVPRGPLPIGPVSAEPILKPTPSCPKDRHSKRCGEGRGEGPTYAKRSAGDQPPRPSMAYSPSAPMRGSMNSIGIRSSGMRTHVKGSAAEMEVDPVPACGYNASTSVRGGNGR